MAYESIPEEDLDQEKQLEKEKLFLQFSNLISAQGYTEDDHIRFMLEELSSDLVEANFKKSGFRLMSLDQTRRIYYRSMRAS